MITFEDVYLNEADYARQLYDLLVERPTLAAISYQAPTWDEHRAFVRSRPYRYWFLLRADSLIAGALYATPRNELGIQIFKEYQRRGYAARAILKFVNEYKPLAPIPSVRSGRWLANIAPKNEASRALFEILGFSKIQETYAL